MADQNNELTPAEAQWLLQTIDYAYGEGLAGDALDATAADALTERLCEIAGIDPSEYWWLYRKAAKS